jgi:hypothetical protein
MLLCINSLQAGSHCVIFSILWDWKDIFWDWKTGKIQILRKMFLVKIFQQYLSELQNCHFCVPFFFQLFLAESNWVKSRYISNKHKYSKKKKLSMHLNKFFYVLCQIWFTFYPYHLTNHFQHQPDINKLDLKPVELVTLKETVGCSFRECLSVFYQFYCHMILLLSTSCVL